MAKNRFDTYDGGANVADYTALMKQRYQEWDQRDENVEAQRKRNDQQRVANANQTQNLVNQVSQLAPTLAKMYADAGERRDNRLRNEAAIEASKWGVDVLDPNLAAARFEGLDKEAREHAYLDTIYQQIIDKNTDENGVVNPDALEYANKLRGLSSYDLKLTKQSWLNNQAANLIPKIKEQLLSGGLDHIKVGENTFANSTDLATDRALLDAVLADYGLNTVNWANDDFLREEFWPTYNQKAAAFLKERQTARNTEYVETQTKQYQERINTVASTQPANLAKSIMELARNNANFYGSQKKAVESLVSGVAQEVKDGKLPLSVMVTLPETTFAHDGQQGKEVSLRDNYPELFEEWDEQLKQIQKGANDQKKVNDGLNEAAFVYTMNQEIDSMEGPITNDFKFQKIIEWRNKHPNTDIPEKLKTLITKEKGDDALLEMDLNAKRRLGLPITMDEINSFDDPNKVNTWKGYKSDGLLNNISQGINTKMKAAVTAAIGDRLTAQKNDKTRSSEWIRIEENAHIYFKEQYLRELKNQPTELDAYNAAMDATELKIADPKFGLGRRYSSSSVNHATNKKKAETAIGNNSNAMNSGILPGTEETFKKVVSDIKAGNLKTIPLIYHQIAATHQYITALDVLNAQLKSQGLPPIQGGTTYNKLIKLGRLGTYHPAKQTKSVLNNVDYSQPTGIAMGLVT